MVSAGWWSRVRDQRGVVALQGAQDLAAHVLVLVAVVAHVEVGELLLGHARARRPGPCWMRVEQRPRVRVVADLEGGAQRLRGLAVAVLAHERVAQPLPGLGVARVDGQGRARRRLRARPVAGLQRRPCMSAEPRAGGWWAGRRLARCR